MNIQGEKKGVFIIRGKGAISGLSAWKGKIHGGQKGGNGQATFWDKVGGIALHSPSH